MYSPFQAVYGHDRTFVKRMTAAEYLREVEDEECDLRGGDVRRVRGGAQQLHHHQNVSAESETNSATPPQYELRRAALSSKNPQVVFSSKYPTYDRLGRELCVLYQMQDMAVEQEYDRLQREGNACRRSGVRLSAELQLDTTCSRVTGVSSSVGSNQRIFGTADLSEDEEDDAVDVTVSTMSRTSSFVPSRPLSARPSEFSIYRDSAKPGIMLARASAVAAANHRESATTGGGGGGRASKKGRSLPLMPSSSVSAGGMPLREVVAYAITTTTAQPQDTRGRSQPLPQRASKALGAFPGSSTEGEDKENALQHLHTLAGKKADQDSIPVPFPIGIRMRKIADEHRIRSSRSRSQKHTREASHAGGRGSRANSARLSRVRFLDDDHEDDRSQPFAEPTEEPGDLEWAAEARKRPRHEPTNVLGGNHPNNTSGSGTERGEEGDGDAKDKSDAPDRAVPMRLNASHNDAHAQDATIPAIDPVRFTVARDTVFARTTKQLFRGTGGGASRGTTSLTHPHPISSTAYGITATSVPASSVFDAVEKNFAACGALSGTFAEEAGAATPELRCGRVIQLGDRWFQLTTFLLVAEAYEAVEVDPPATQPANPRATEEAKPEAAAQCPPPTADGVLTAYEEEPPKMQTHAANTASEAPAVLTAFEEEEAHNAGNEPPKHAVEWLPPAHGASRCQHLIYRWRNRHVPYSGNESRRAAAGLCLCAPEVSVSGYTYADGGGITLLTLPEDYRATSLSSLPLATASYTTLLKLVLRVLASLVARRLTHANLISLGEVLIAFKQTSAADGGTTITTSSSSPVIFPIHWERAVDFSMFLDRNVGRTLPYDSEDGTERPLRTLGMDVAALLQCFLEHKQSAELTSEQYLLLQKLIVMAGEPTQVANYLVQITSLMTALSTDLPALRQAYNAAVVFYDN